MAAAQYAHALAQARAADHANQPGNVARHRPPLLTDPVWLVLAVAVVLVDKQRRVLVARRAAHKHWGGMWEFPGGKVGTLYVCHQAAPMLDRWRFVKHQRLQPRGKCGRRWG